MASGNEPGDIRVVIEDPYGNQQVTHKFRSDSAINAGKSPDGVLANLTVDTQVIVGTAGRVATAGDKILVLFSQDSADGLDASDCVIQIPVTLDDGSEQIISSSDLGFTTDYPASSVASYWKALGSGYTIPRGMRCKIGSASRKTPIVISIEDDA